MKVYIRYFRTNEFGNYATKVIDIDPESLVIDLKRIIFARVGTEIKYQQLSVKNHGHMEVMKDECSISFYDVKEGAYVFMDNLHHEQSESDQIKEATKKLSKVQNPKYLQKLGIVRNILNSEVQGPDQNKDQKIVDELCNAIKQGFNLKEFMYFCQQIFSVDAKGDSKANSEIYNFNFETVGSQGWNCLHVACTTGKTDIVEYLLNNLKVDPNVEGKKDKWTALEIAVQFGFFQILNLLIEDKRLNVNQVNSLERGSALHLAAKSNYLPICQVLLLKGIDLSIQDANGNFAKQLATHSQIKNLIEKYEKHYQAPEIVIEEIKEVEEDESSEDEENAKNSRGVSPLTGKDNKISTQSKEEVKKFQQGKDTQSTDKMSTLNIVPKQARSDQKKGNRTSERPTRERPKSKVVAIFQNQASPKSSMHSDFSNSPRGLSTEILPSARMLGLEEIIETALNTSSQVKSLISTIKSLQTPYKAFFPLKRLKGKLYKVQRMKLTSYQRYLYVNPIEGVLISYHNTNKFPHQPSYIIKLNEIKEVKVLMQSEWFFKRGYYYFTIRTEEKRVHFYENNLDLIDFWVSEISLAKRFYQWYKSLMDMRYSIEINNEENSAFVEEADELIDFIVGITLPEVDADQYSTKQNISVKEYAERKAAEFRSVASNNGKELSHSSDSTQRKEDTKSPSREEYLSGSHSDVETQSKTRGKMASQEIVYQFEDIGATEKKMMMNSGFQKDLATVQKLQQKLNDGASPKQQQSQSLPNSAQKPSTKVKLLDDGEKGVGFSSFQLMEILGQGTFGKVFRVKMKSSEEGQEYAMKVLKKAFLVKNNHLKYAIAECNILKQADNPFVLKMHYSFQTPDNLYMILDICTGGDLAFHLNKRQIFDETESQFYIAEVILAIEYMHSLNIIYRDLKPENILISADGHVKLADFGLAKQGINDKQNAKSFCGSPAYLAPEMLNSKGVGKASDLYQLGAVLYELLVGFPPYYTENIKKLYDNIKQAKLQIPSYISAPARDLLTKLLHKNPKMRIGVTDKNEIKRHPFFRGLNWNQLAKKEITPPLHLTLDEEDETEEMQYLKAVEKVRFKDEDYNQENKTLNRVKQFTFIKNDQQH